jgi:hypothetical protein
MLLHDEVGGGRDPVAVERTDAFIRRDPRRGIARRAQEIADGVVELKARHAPEQRATDPKRRAHTSARIRPATRSRPASRPRTSSHARSASRSHAGTRPTCAGRSRCVPRIADNPLAAADADRHKQRGGEPWT